MILLTRLKQNLDHVFVQWLSSVGLGSVVRGMCVCKSAKPLTCHRLNLGPLLRSDQVWSIYYLWPPLIRWRAEPAKFLFPNLLPFPPGSCALQAFMIGCNWFGHFWTFFLYPSHCVVWKAHRSLGLVIMCKLAMNCGTSSRVSDWRVFCASVIVRIAKWWQHVYSRISPNLSNLLGSWVCLFHIV